MLAVGVDPQLGVVGLAGRPVAAQLGQVGVEREEPDLARNDVDALGAGLVPGFQVGGQGVGGGVGVIAHQMGGKLVEQPGQPGLDGRVRAGLREFHVLGGRLSLVLAVAERLEAHQRRLALDLAAGHHVQLPHPGGEGGDDRRLHLHRLQDDHRCAGGDLLADRDRGGDHQRRGRRAQHSALVPGDPVGDAVDLDQVRRAVGVGDDPEPLAPDLQPAMDVVQPFQPDVRGRVPDAHPVVAGAGAEDDHPVRDPAQLEVDRHALGVLGLRTSAAGGLQQVGDLALLGLLVGLDGGRDQGDRPVPVGDQAALGAHPVDPAGVGGAVDHLGAVEQFQHEALVGGAAVDDDGGLGHRPPEAAQGFVAGASGGDDLGDHRVEVGGDRVTLGDAGVDPDAGADRQVEPGDQAGGGGEVAVGVLGVEPGLDGVPLLDRTVGEPAARCDVQLSFDKVEVVGDLGDRVLHLQAGVHLEEGEELVLGVVEELDRPRSLVVDRQREPLGRVLEFGVLLGAQQRRGGFLDHLLVAALHRAVADAERPGRPLAVRDHLHLDVAGAGDQLFQEDHPGAEGPLGLLAGALVGVGEVFGNVHPADAASATAGGGLEHERVADPAGGGQRLVQAVDRAAAPRRDRHADLLGDQLGADLVAQLAHGVPGWADEGDAEGFHQVGETGVLGDEAPAHPDRVRPRLCQHPGEQFMVEVGTLGGRAERVRLVGLADEHGRAFGVGVERDDGDLGLGGPLGVQVADGVDEPHRRLTTIDDRDALEHRASQGQGR